MGTKCVNVAVGALFEIRGNKGERKNEQQMNKQTSENNFLFRILRFEFPANHNDLSDLFLMLSQLRTS